MKRGCPTHPKIEILKSALSIPHAQAIGHLELLFHFTAQFSPAGDVGKWPYEVIATRCGWEGDPGTFIAALILARLVDKDDVHGLITHDWSEHAEDSVHLTLARGVQLFADGAPPKLTKLSRVDREVIESDYKQRFGPEIFSAHRSPKMRTEAHRSAQPSHAESSPRQTDAVAVPATAVKRPVLRADTIPSRDKTTAHALRPIAVTLVDELASEHPFPGNISAAYDVAETVLSEAEDPVLRADQMRHAHPPWCDWWRSETAAGRQPFIPQLHRWFGSRDWKHPPRSSRTVSEATESEPLRILKRRESGGN